jgi:nucleoside-diphosphate kinase
MRSHNTAQLAQGEVLAFKVMWHDKQALLNRNYILTYYSESNSIGMTDAKNGKLFLKKSPMPASVNIQDFFVGGKVQLHSRELTVVEYKDEYTRNKQEQFRETVFAGISADSISAAGDILTAIAEAGNASIQRLKYASLTAREASRFGLSDGPVIGISVVGSNATETVNALQNSYGISIGNSDTANSFFKNTPQTATYDSCTCCVIKPHAVAAGNAGKIISMLQSMGFEISAMGMFEMEQAEAKEFLEVYDGVTPTYQPSCVEMCSGPMIAMEIRCENPVETLRQAAGPWDVEMAQELRPRTIRATFGVDNVKNAIHCTDLPEDAASECEYFFYHMSPL